MTVSNITTDTPQTTTTTTPNTADANAKLHARLAEIMQQHKESEAAEMTEADAIAEAEATIERERRRIKDTQDRITASRMHRDQLAREMARTEAAVYPDPITLDVAQQAADDLLAAFDQYRGDAPTGEGGPRWANSRPKQVPTLNERIRAFWDSHDRIRNRLLSPDVADDAVELTLAVEGVLLACSRFEEDRSGRMSDEDGAHMSGLGNAPPECRHVMALEADCRAFLNGDPPPELETIGSLILQGIRFEQIAKMIGLVRPNGQPDLQTFAMLIETPDHFENSFRYVRWHGAYSVATAWLHRQSQLAHRRATNRPHSDVMSHG